MKPETLSRQLRKGSGPFLARRRGIVGLSLVSVNAMGLIVLYQMGIIEHLPEPPIAGLDADKVDASAEAYAYFSTPDAVIGLGSYAVTMGLAAMGGQDREIKQPWIPLALAAKVLVDAAQAGKLTVDQWTKHRAFCFWCLLAAGATFATVPLAIPEARAALREVSGKTS
ncbi:MAG TPA: vitamin K epoxide reductase family protein [Herpetosiphonaceae bacterium]|nr:vitamin K epoxide reductase family protein [Herpetosiphonaceae bacterium]